jgi:hypothetical protein
MQTLYGIVTRIMHHEKQYWSKQGEGSIHLDHALLKISGIYIEEKRKMNNKYWSKRARGVSI